MSEDELRRASDKSDPNIKVRKSKMEGELLSKSLSSKIRQYDPVSDPQNKNKGVNVDCNRRKSIFLKAATNLEDLLSIELMLYLSHAKQH